MAAGGSALQISEELGEGVRTLHLAGELDLAGAPRLQARLSELDPGAGGELVLDLSRLEFLDSTGLRILLEATETLRATATELQIRNLQPQVRDVIELAGLDRLLPLSPS